MYIVYFEIYLIDFYLMLTFYTFIPLRIQAISDGMTKIVYANKNSAIKCNEQSETTN